MKTTIKSLMEQWHDLTSSIGSDIAIYVDGAEKQRFALAGNAGDVAEGDIGKAYLCIDGMFCRVVADCGDGFLYVECRGEKHRYELLLCLVNGRGEDNVVVASGLRANFAFCPCKNGLFTHSTRYFAISACGDYFWVRDKLCYTVYHGRLADRDFFVDLLLMEQNACLLAGCLKDLGIYCKFVGYSCENIVTEAKPYNEFTRIEVNCAGCRLRHRHLPSDGLNGLVGILQCSDTFETASKSMLVSFDKTAIEYIQAILLIGSMDRKALLGVKRDCKEFRILEKKTLLSIKCGEMQILWSYGKIVLLKIGCHAFFTERSRVSKTTERHLGFYGMEHYNSKYEIREACINSCGAAESVTLDRIRAGTGGVSTCLPKCGEVGGLSRHEVSLIILTDHMIKKPLTWEKRGLHISRTRDCEYRYRNSPVSIAMHDGKPYSITLGYCTSEYRVIILEGSDIYNNVLNSYTAYDYMESLTHKKAIEAIEEEMNGLLSTALVGVV